MRRVIGVVLHPGFQLLDVAGPTSAFEIAERFRPGSYEVRLLAPGGGQVESSSGALLSTRPLRHRSLDTVIVSGGEIIRSPAAAEEIVRWLKRAQTRRIASVCSGAFFLAEAGRLDGRRATTHWDSTDHFRRRYPQVTLDPDRIFVRDREIWTSAGITAGIDLALALIEDDLGADMELVERREPKRFGLSLQWNTWPSNTGTGGSPSAGFHAATGTMYVWAWRDNPNGAFADWNTRVSCEGL